jgi:hypothetical protein
MPSNLERKARRAKQTRLTFDPINIGSSSPSGASLSPVKVRYQVQDQRTTPSSSRQTYNNEEGGESDDPIFSDKKPSFDKKYNFGMKSPAKRKRDGKLPFKALPNPAKSVQMETNKGNSPAGKSSVCSTLSSN